MSVSKISVFVAGAVLGLGASVPSVHGAILTQWSFNSPVPDSNMTTGTLEPVVGSGSVAPSGGVAGGFASGVVNGGSSDPVVSDNSALQATTFPDQGVANDSAGYIFRVSTQGYNITSVSYDLRHGMTSSRYELFQYTLDGTTFTDLATFDGNAGDTWFNHRSIDVSGIAGVSDNVNFGFRVVAAFAPGTSTYVPSGSSSTYSSTGTWRFDMVGVSGSPVAVPEPTTLGLLAPAGMLLGRRRRA